MNFTEEYGENKQIVEFSSLKTDCQIINDQLIPINW